MGKGRSHFASPPKPSRGGGLRGGHGRPTEPWQYGDPRAGAMSFTDHLHWSGYAAPYILGVIIVPLWAILPRLLFGSSSSLLAVGAFVLVIVGGVLTYATWDESRPRRQYQRLRAAGSVFWVFLAPAVTLALSDPLDYGWWGPGSWWSIHPRWWLAEVLVGLCLAIWWTIGGLPAVKGDGLDQHAGSADALAEALGIGQTHPRGKVKVDGVRRQIPLRLKGVSIDALRQASGLIAVMARVPRNGVRVVEDPQDASAPDLILVTEDVLRTMSTPPPPTRPGGSITEPVRCGLREDATVVESVRMEKGFGGQHVIVGGKTGGGKTSGLLEELYDVVTRRDVVLLHSDTRKSGQTFPDIAPAFARVATTASGTVKLVDGLNRVIVYRSEHVGRCWSVHSLDHYGNPMPALGISIEEAAAVAERLGSDLRAFLETARSVGIFLTLSMQRPSGNLLDTDTRAQFGEGWCFPVMRDEDAAMVLNEETILSGATPEVWGPKTPEYSGYFYRECGPAEKHAMPARAWNRNPMEIRRHFGQWAPSMAWGRGPEGLDQGTAEALGEAWTDLTSGADYALAHGWTRSAAGVWTPPPLVQEDDGPGHPLVGQPLYGTPPVTQVVQTQENAPGQPAQVDQEDTDEEDRMDGERELAQVRAEVAEELEEDRELSEHDGEEDDAPASGTWSPEDFPVAEEEVVLEAGQPLPDGTELDYRGRVLAAADVIDSITGGAGGRRRTVKTGVLVEAWYEVPGVTQAQRPALNRLLRKLVKHGEAEDAGRGRWTLEHTAGGWLRRHAEELEAEGDDGE